MKRRMPQQGFSLVELLIAMLLGLVLTTGVLNMYLGSTESSRFTEGVQAIQENGRFGVNVLQRGLRLAGYSPDARLDPIDIAAGSDSRIVVRMRQAFDCNGQSTAPTSGIAVNTYAFDAVAQQITCTGNSAVASAMPLVDGVEGFRVLYGIDGNGDDVPESYVSYDAGLNPSDIASLRFGILVNSLVPIRSRDRSETHVLLDQTISTNDRFARNVFTSTVKLRNRR